MPVRYSITGSRATEIAASVERSIASGELPPGSPLPPIRGLATSLQVNPNTVAAAYRQLRDRGVIETAGRRGSRVRARPASTPRSAPAPPLPDGVRDLSTGMPAPDLLPDLRPAVTTAAVRRLRYGDAAVSAELAGEAARRLRADRAPSAERVAVMSGALDAIDRVLNTHLRSGDAVAVEDPCWSNLLDLIAALGLVPLPVVLDDDGPLPDAVGAAARRGARAFIVTTRSQNPTGAAVSRTRASELRRAAASYQLLIEDDHGAELAGVPLYTLCGHTPHWAYVRSVSKAYGPDLRLAVLTGDETTLDRVRGKQRLGPGWVSHLLQETVVALWRDDGAERQVAAARETYAARRHALLGELSARGIIAHGKTGLHVYVPVPDETAAVANLLAAGWAVAPGSRFRLSSGPAIRITVAELSEDDAPALADAVMAATMRRRPDSIPNR